MGWMPGLVWKPGHNAGNLGNRKQNVRLHYTVGRDSTGIGLNGYFHFLVPKEGTPIQFAPTEAVCWDACEWNPQGYGIEIERLSDAEPLTDSQIAWVGRIAHWANESDGIPLTFRDSPGQRVEPSAGFRGFITHRSLAEHKCDQHYDYITQDDWNRALGSGPAPTTITEDDMPAGIFAEGTYKAYAVTDKGALVERWGGPGAPNETVILEAGGPYPMLPESKGGRVSVARNPVNPNDYAVSALRSDGSFVRTAFRVGGKWVKE